MRRIPKGTPPRNVSPDGQVQRTLDQAERALLEEFQQVVNVSAPSRSACARSAFDALDKSKLRNALHHEQGSLCIYCESRLTTEERVVVGRPAARIDHWRPLSLNPELALHWRNLYLSCTSQTSCDCRKQNSPLRLNGTSPDLPWPSNHPYEQCVGFNSLGEIYVRSDAPLDEAQRRALSLAIGIPHDEETTDNGILNLNHPTLVSARLAALKVEKKGLERDYPSKTVDRQDRERRAAKMLADRPIKSYVSIRVAWLCKTLGAGK